MSDCLVAAFSGADTDGLLNRQDIDLAISAQASMGGPFDRRYDLVDQACTAYDLELYMGRDIHGNLGLALLFVSGAVASKAANIRSARAGESFYPV